MEIVVPTTPGGAIDRTARVTVDLYGSLALTGIATLVIGIYPEPFLRLAQTSLFR